MAGSFERKPEVKMGCSQTGIQTDRLPERGDCSWKVTVVGDEYANRVMGHGVRRVQRNCRTEGDECRGGVAAGHERGAALAMLRSGD